MPSEQSIRRGVLIAVFAIVGACPVAAPFAQKTVHTEDRILFAQDNEVRSIAPSGGDTSSVAVLPFSSNRMKGMQIASDGTALLVRGNGYSAWAEIAPDSQSEFRKLPCASDSRISADGSRVVCATLDKRRIAVYTMRPSLTVKIIDREPTGALAFGEGPIEIITEGDNDDLIAISEEGERVVSPHRPDASLTVTPDGRRALGAYKEDPIHVVYAFRLDGKSIKRTLVHAARSRSISADSTWATIQQEVDACAVRIAGGEYKCWRKFFGLSVSSDARTLLMSRFAKPKHELFLGEIAGTSSRKPTPLIEGVAKHAVFWPQSAFTNPTK